MHRSVQRVFFLTEFFLLDFKDFDFWEGFDFFKDFDFWEDFFELAGGLAGAPPCDPLGLAEAGESLVFFC